MAVPAFRPAALVLGTARRRPQAEPEPVARELIRTTRLRYPEPCHLCPRKRGLWRREEPGVDVVLCVKCLAALKSTDSLSLRQPADGKRDP